MRWRNLRRHAGRTAVIVLGVYVLFLGGMFIVMCQPPERFGRIMAHVPMPTLLIVPFERMWNVARGGSVHVGDPAPEFLLSTIDRKSQIQLSSFRGKQPVVLVFGSYT